MNTISRHEIHQRLVSKQETLLIEALPLKYFQESHLPQAININHDEIEQLAPKFIPNKDTPIVVYCSNTACNNSTLAANKLERLGYQNVYKYAEGKQDWQDAGLPVERS